MADVLLTHSYFMRFDKKQWRNMQPYAPLATLYAASVLRAGGIDVALFDSMLAGSEAMLTDSLRRHHPAIVAIYDDCFNYLSKMCLERMRLAAFEMIALARREGMTVVVFSSDSADNVDEYLSRGADFIIKGEGEQTLLELCSELLSGRRDFQRVNGIAYTVEGGIIETMQRLPSKNLDSLPSPAWDLIDMAEYKKAWKRHGYFSMNVVTTRGCPFGCNWCAKPIYGRVYNSRSPQNVVDEILFLKELYAPTHIWFCDDIFGLRPGWLEEFSAAAAGAGMNIRYKCLSRPDLLLKENSFAALARSGCDTVWLGAESGSQAILDAMEKGTTVDQIRLATRRLKKEKIKVGYFIQFGYPGESYSDIKKTLDLVSDEHPDEIGVSVSYPLPNTKFFETVRAKLGNKRNWYDSDDLAPLFPGEFKPAFYKILHRIIHSIHRVKKIAGRLEKMTPRTILAFCYNALKLPIYFILLQFARRRNPNRIPLNEDIKGIV
jgi:radical SAM superfamily enzyme YgiQ (UPF0313 family)